MSDLRVISYGGGVQSTALVVLAAQGEIDFSHALFANVGDDSEHPDTLEYVNDIIKPWSADQQVDVVELHRQPTKGRFKGEVETLYKRLTHPDSRSVGIPIRMSNTGAPGTRACTKDFKIRVVGKWLKEHGATPDNPARVAIGFSTDEIHRVSNRRQEPNQVVEYPLLDLGLSRSNCQRVIADAGLPVPPKSSCYFCPFHSLQYWSEMKRDRPDLFEKSAELETHLNERRQRLGKDPVWFTRKLKPLDEAIHEAQESLFGDWDLDGSCDDGYCFV